ncbi:MAG TPA: prolyl oligopeptidase family serine peptidase [Gaiellaceae bacterium]|nr:prolyl oligopeptidase family serine peptidase [Gaiellaceae bacterium]
MTVRPYGTWPSEITFETISRVQAGRFSALDVRGDRVRWSESRASEGGRTVIVEWRDGELRDLLPEGFNARTRVHEYGGGAVWHHGDTVFFSEFSTSVLHRLDPGAEPVAIVPDPPAPNSLRYADGCVSPDGARVWCVRERHEDEVWNELVTLAADGSEEPRIVASGHDFYAAPRLSPDGARLSFLAWDHPRMPWDGTELYVADVAPDGTLGEPRRVAGGGSESVIEPAWSPDGRLHFCTDRSGWWNLHRLEADGAETALTSFDDAEIGFPDWVFAMRRYAFLADGRIACVVTRRAVDSLELLDPETGGLEPAGLDFTGYDPSALAAGNGLLAFAALSPTEPLTVCLCDAGSGELRRIRRSLAAELDPAGVSTPRAIEFPTRDGGVAHAFFYPPHSAEWEGPPDERPPLRVICHGGPTAHVSPELDPNVQFFTQRGIGVVDVNYRGSTGYGREYRRLLEGRWGDTDWRDCVDAARFLADQGEADPARTWVEGGSAGGYVVLCAAVFEPDAFAAGVSLFGVADLTPFVHDTHKFESRYLDTLVGPYPECADLYRARSPVEFADDLARPLLLLQGLDDKVVPPSQAELMVEVLERKRIPYAYIAFEDEGHGFRKEENIRRTLEAILGFVGRVFGFEPADELEPLEIRHL